jgi:Protein of unknown function (DUF3300)
MRLSNEKIKTDAIAIVLLTVVLAVIAAPAFAQGPPMYPPQELERLVSRIALYPDPLLAQVLAAATFPDQIFDAARWADQHHYLTGDDLARAIAEDRLPWDPSIQALLPFSSVLDMMAGDMGWTNALGNAFLSQREEVMETVQRLRRQAWDFGYLRSNGQIVVSGGPYVEILPANPAFVCVPYYDPVVVFARPRPGFFVGGAIRSGYGVQIGPAFRPWGWGANRFAWNSHTVIINNNNWNRTWVNRTTYVHPYTVERYNAPRPEERHDLRERSEREREAARFGRERVEEHGRGHEPERDREHHR